MDQGLTHQNKEPDNVPEKVKAAFEGLARTTTQHVKAIGKPGFFVVEVHHDSDEIKIIKVSHTEKIETVTL